MARRYESSHLAIASAVERLTQQVGVASAYVVSPALKQLTERVGVASAFAASPALKRLTEQVGTASAFAASPAIKQLGATAMFEQLGATSAFEKLGAASAFEKLGAASAFAASPAFQQLTEQVGAASAAFALSPGWQRFTEDLAAYSENVTARIARMTDPSEFARNATAVMAAAAVINGAAIAEPDDDLQAYDFSGLSDPNARLSIQATVAVVVFIYTFAWVVDTYDLASKLNTLTGVGSPLMMAQVAWSLTKRILDRLASKL